MKHCSNMKFSLVAILAAFLCATAVSGAPSTPKVTFQELALSETFDIAENFSQWADKLRCIINILDKEIASQLEDLWIKARTELNELLAKWEECASAGSVIEQLTCRANVITRTVTIVNEIFNELRKVADPEKLKDVQQQIITKCLKESAFDSSEEAEEFAIGSLPEQSQCLVDVLGAVSKQFGLEELWSRSQPQLQLHLDNWKGCAKITNKYLNFVCNAKEGATLYRLMMEYFKLVANEKPTALIEFARQAQNKCNTHQTFEELMEIDTVTAYGIGNVIDKLNCILNAVTEAVIGTDFAKPWDKMVAKIGQYIENIAACKDQPTDLEEAKCVIRESAKAFKIIFNFIKDVEHLNSELYNNIKKQIKNKCYK